MGKIADNERIKLRATFYNNIGVGLIVVGVLIPTLRALPAIGQFLADVTYGRVEWSLKGVADVLVSAIVFVGTMWIGVLMRKHADEEIGKLED